MKEYVIGLGVSDNETNKTFISTIGNFNDVLQSLNKEHSGKDRFRVIIVDVIKKMKKREKKLKKKEEKRKDGKKEEKKEKKHHKPKVAHKWVFTLLIIGRYQKVLRNKSVSTYSPEDLNAILGISPIEEDSSC